MRTGKPIGRPKGPYRLRLLAFYENVAVAGDDECWLWRGGNTTASGYGIAVRMILGTRLVHRISYAINVADLVPGMEIDHLCRTRLCVNPRHLEQVTRAENNFRRRRTHCLRGHEYSVTGVTVQYRANGSLRSRACRECARIWGRSHYRKRTPKEVR